MQKPTVNFEELNTGHKKKNYSQSKSLVALWIEPNRVQFSKYILTTKSEETEGDIVDRESFLIIKTM